MQVDCLRHDEGKYLHAEGNVSAMMRTVGLALVGVLTGIAIGCGAGETNMSQGVTKTVDTNGAEIATFAAGCFWCTEAVFQRTKGVLSVRSGYIGGKKESPTYKEVCTGTTGHAEALEITFDPKVVTYRELLNVFWHMHDPTTLNRQGADVGTQYRSAVFYHSEAQKKDAEAVKEELTKARTFRNPIVTEIVAASKFYPAEDYHQDYYNQNKSAGYCRAVIAPKLKKLGIEDK